LYQEQGISENHLHQIWKAAKRRNIEAGRALLQLLRDDPKLAIVFAVFASERAHKVFVATGHYPNSRPEVKPLGPWERARSRATGWVSVVGGGLPSPGKRR